MTTLLPSKPSVVVPRKQVADGSRCLGTLPSFAQTAEGKPSISGTRRKRYPVTLCSCSPILKPIRYFEQARQTLLSNGIIPVLADPATLDANKSALKVAIDFGKSLGLCQERDNVVVMQRIQNQRVVSMLQVD